MMSEQSYILQRLLSGSSRVLMWMVALMNYEMYEELKEKPYFESIEHRFDEILTLGKSIRFLFICLYGI